MLSATENVDTLLEFLMVNTRSLANDKPSNLVKIGISNEIYRRTFLPPCGPMSRASLIRFVYYVICKYDWASLISIRGDRVF